MKMLSIVLPVGNLVPNGMYRREEIGVSDVSLDKKGKRDCFMAFPGKMQCIFLQDREGSPTNRSMK